MPPTDLLDFFKEQGQLLAESIWSEMHGIEANLDVCLREGNPAMEILRLAQGRDVDMILIGNRGLSGIASVLLGSVSQRVARNARCSVLIVRSSDEPNQAGAAARSKGRVTCCSDRYGAL